MKILITGAAGFIGSALCSRLALNNKIIGVDVAGFADEAYNIVGEQADISDLNSLTAICEKYSPDAVIHCAGITHQKMGVVDYNTYMRVNSETTENLAKIAAKYNSDIRFIFLSSVSVYGEGPQITQKGKNSSNNGVSENSGCRPSGDYAVSKLDAERRLIALIDEGIIHNLVVLRLAPVYDRSWSLNLDRRVFAPKKLAYFRYGTGTQRMSALARPNLVDFISHILQVGGRNLQIFNVCDAAPYEFNTIIRTFRKSGICAKRPVISVPLSVIWFVARIAGVLFFKKREWIYSCYNKLASHLVFDNRKMIKTGFRPGHSLRTIFLF